MKAEKPILFPLKKRHGEIEFESSMRGSAHKIQKTRNLHNVLLNENFIHFFEVEQAAAEREVRFLMDVSLSHI